eukprot:TRINITY_DN6777_c0_g1_i1.p1 TRINITY_DN6777_c0_g1~~TRINITY_DN6777_c0_g1_i1.p1  ORF type:complete len:235 (+),score=65.55 TRINITY_DN6777_c0_g1_i1:74-778(+)
MERTAKKKQLRLKTSKKDKEVTIEKSYLAIYNFAQFGGWAYLFFLIMGVWLEYMLEPSTAAVEAWDTVRVTLLIFQNAQVLEILHVMIGLVSSNLLTTSIQTLMKLFIVIICYLLPSARESFAFSSLIFAWSAGEIIRYMYYAMSNPLIVGKQTPDFVPYLRYTGFIVLYPIGFLSEFVILLKAFGAAQSGSYSIFVLPLGALLLGYWPVAAYMYKSMLRQRAKHLNPAKEASE